MSRGGGHLYRRGNIWWYAVSVKGRLVRQSTGETSETKARKKLRAALSEVDAGTYVEPDVSKLTVDDLLDRLVEDYEINGRHARELAYQLRPVRAALGRLPALKLTEPVIERFKGKWLKQGLSNGTVNRRFAAVRRAFRLAYNRRQIGRVPYFGQLKEGAPRQGFVTASAFEEIAERLPQPIQDFARFGFLTAWRKGAIRTLTWSAVELSPEGPTGIWLRPEHSKNDHPLFLPVEGQLKEILKRRLADRQGEADLVFHRAGRQIRDFRTIWKKATEEAGMAGVLFHDLRRSAIRGLVRSGVRERVVMEISGHRTRSVFDRYNVTSEDDLRAAMKAREETLKKEVRRIARA